MIFVSEADREKTLASGTSQGKGEQKCSQGQSVHHDGQNDRGNQRGEKLGCKVHVELRVRNPHKLLNLCLQRGWTIGDEHATSR